MKELCNLILAKRELKTGDILAELERKYCKKSG